MMGCCVSNLHARTINNDVLRTQYAGLNVTDIAGLVKGASEGAGLGNAFLSHIQAVDGYVAVFSLCRIAYASLPSTHIALPKCLKLLA
jgi:ribosome-binding ATPase YchF (GTP1/OBG family)